MDDSANKENPRALTRLKLVQELQNKPNNPAAWLQLISHELALAGGDVKKCLNLGKVFENARQSVTKEFFQTEEYLSLCLGNARWFITTCHYDHCKELLKWLKVNKIGLYSADYYITFAHLESALGDDQKAQDHIRRGLKVEAQPKKELEKYLADFKHSINVAPLIFTPRRSPLSELNAQGISTPATTPATPSLKVLSPPSDSSLTTPIRPSSTKTSSVSYLSSSASRDYSSPSETPSTTPMARSSSASYLLTTPSASVLTQPTSNAPAQPTQGSVMRPPTSTNKDWFKKEASRFPRLPPPTRVLRDEDTQMAESNNASTNASTTASANASSDTTNASTTYLNPLTTAELSTPARPSSLPASSASASTSVSSRILLDTVMEVAEQLSSTPSSTATAIHTTQHAASAHNFTQNSNILSDSSLSHTNLSTTNLSQGSQTNITMNTSQSNTGNFQSSTSQNGELLRSQSDGAMVHSSTKDNPMSDTSFTDPGVSKSIANEASDTHHTESYAPVQQQMDLDSEKQSAARQQAANNDNSQKSHKIQLSGHKQSQNRYPVYYQRQLEQKQLQQQQQQQLQQQQIQQQKLQGQQLPPQYSAQKIPQSQQPPLQQQQQQRVLHPQSSYPSGQYQEPRVLPAQSSYPTQSQEQQVQPRVLPSQSSYPSQPQNEQQRVLLPQSSFPTNQPQNEQQRVLYPQSSYPSQAAQEPTPLSSQSFLPPAPIGQQYSIPSTAPHQSASTLPTSSHPVTNAQPAQPLSSQHQLLPPQPLSSQPLSSQPQIIPPQPLSAQPLSAQPLSAQPLSSQSLSSQQPLPANHQFSKKSKSAEEMQRNFELAQQWNGGRTFFVNNKPYIVLENIGRGGSSKVYKVLSANLEIFALKQVFLDRADESTINNYLNEINLLQTLRGKNNIIQLIDSEINAANSVILLVLEYGESDLNYAWQTHVQHSRAHSGNFLRIFWQQMLEAVHTVHQQRIVHSDLKLANFVLVKGAVKLIDFGIAKQISNDTTHVSRDELSGTINYMSPEALTDVGATAKQVKQGRPSDVWSLGCILYQMVYGHPPFHALNLAQKFKCIPDKNYPINFPAHPDHGLLEVLRACLQRDPALRPTIPQLLSHPFLMPMVSLQEMETKLRAQEEEIIRLRQQLATK